MSVTKYHDEESLSQWGRVLVKQLHEFTVHIYASASRIGTNSNPECQAEQRSESTEQRSLRPGQSHPCEVSSPCLCSASALHVCCTHCQLPPGCLGGFRALSFPILKHEAGSGTLYTTASAHTPAPRREHTGWVWLLPEWMHHVSTKHILQYHFPWRNIQRLLCANC